MPSVIRRLVSSEGLCPSDSPTRALARRFVGALRSRGSLAVLARSAFVRWPLVPFEQPALTIAIGPESRQCRRAAANGRQRQWMGRVRDGLGHHSVRAIGELVDPPQLLWAARERRKHYYVTTFFRRESAIGPGDGDLEV